MALLSTRYLYHGETETQVLALDLFWKKKSGNSATHSEASVFPWKSNPVRPVGAVTVSDC